MAYAITFGESHPEWLDRYVDGTNGSDSNSGLTPATAMATIQAAYDDLVAAATAGYSANGTYLGVGRIFLSPGLHDVAGGVTMDNQKPVAIYGTRGGTGYHLPSDSPSTIYSSSAVATEMILIDDTAVVGRGFRFEDIVFRISSVTNTALTKVIYADGICHLNVERCTCFNVNEAATAVTFIYHESNGDASWARIFNNTTAHVQLYKCPDSASNYNRNLIHYNNCFYGGTQPIIHILGEFLQGSISYNNLEGPVQAPAIKIENTGADWNVIWDNCGEGGGATHAFIELTGGNSNVIGGGICKSAAANGIFVKFGTDAYSNLVIGSYDTVGTTGFMRKVVDSSTFGNHIIDSRWGGTVKYKTGTAPTFSDSDWTSAPPNGTIGIAYGSTGPTYKLWARLNDTWKSVDMA